MRSIRSRLLLWLLPGLGLLLGVAGVGLYLAVEHGLESRLDAELRSLAGPARFLARAQLTGFSRPGGIRGAEFTEFDDDRGETFFAAWRENGEELSRSRSLGSRSLSRPAVFPPQGEFRDEILPDGLLVRTLAIRVPGPPPGRPREFQGPPGVEAFLQNLGRLEAGAKGGPKRGSNRGPAGRPVRKGDDGAGRGGLRDPIDLVVARSRRRIDETLNLLLGGILVAGLGAGFGAVFLVRIALAAGLKPLELVGDQAVAIDTESLQKRFPAEDLPEELRSIAMRLNDLMARLEAGFERERRFGADLAHELRTPVAELRSMAEVALKWPDRVSAENYADLKVIAGRMQGTIENLLRLARLENGQARRMNERIELAALVDSEWRLVAERAQQRKLSPRFLISGNATVSADPELLKTVLANLFSNAVEYADEGSEVVVANGRDEIIAVTNVARALEPEDLPLMFDRLWRLDKSRTSGGHSGLGLAIAKACADAMGCGLAARLDEGRLRMALRLKD